MLSPPRGRVAPPLTRLQGDVSFASQKSGWAGPLFSISGSSVTLDGNAHTFNGNGQDYWDGYGSNKGITKPISTNLVANALVLTLFAEVHAKHAQWLCQRMSPYSY